MPPMYNIVRLAYRVPLAGGLTGKCEADGISLGACETGHQAAWYWIASVGRNLDATPKFDLYVASRERAVLSESWTIRWSRLM